MKNALFDDLKELKKEMVDHEKRENEKKAKEISDEKEKILKEEFLDFINENGIKKIDK